MEPLQTAVEFVSQLADPPLISAMTVAELYVGVRHQEEALLERLRVVATSADVAGRAAPSGVTIATAMTST
ncbi:MAG: hypothetical protein ACREJ5_17640 [Geminicoccaceae bacterium]